MNGTTVRSDWHERRAGVRRRTLRFIVEVEGAWMLKPKSVSRVMKIVVWSLLAGVSSCGGGGDGDGGGGGSGSGSGGGGGGGGANVPALTDVIDPAPGGTNAVMPIFSRPFDAEYDVLNYFDHDKPIHPDDTNGYQLTWRGSHAIPGQDLGGYDG